MAVSPYTQVSSASLAGLVTDGNALMTTEQSNLDESNYEILRDGTRRRRRPIVQETSGDDTFLGSSIGSYRSAFLWKGPAFRDNYSILCEEINGEIRFYPIDHDTPEYLRTRELDQDRLRLELWGDRDYVSRDRLDAKNIDGPCTYAEGNGALFIFNPRSGTIKITLSDDERLIMSPVGTWVRDYIGMEEAQEIDYRIPKPNTYTAWSASVPYDDPAEDVFITSDLPNDRAYNLSNSGWDAQGVSKFMLGTRNELWPAYTDKYLSGRQVSEDGEDTFSYQQLLDARVHKSLPPLGARLNTSDFSEAGTLVALPSDLSDDVVVTYLGRSDLFYNISVNFNERQAHKSNIAAGETSLLFVHACTFTVQEGGRTYQGGFSGCRRSIIDPTDPTSVSFVYVNSALGYSNLAIESLYAYPSPEYFPHHGFIDNEDIPTSWADQRPVAGEVFAGRLWQTSDEHNRVYYSQVLDTETEYNDRRSINREALCYSAGDPTDGDDNAVVPTDGGYINTSDTGKHYGLVTLGDSLLLLTDRGVWAIRPGSKGTFSASDYTFNKILGAEVLGPQAYASLGDSVHVATEEGIMAFKLESTSFGNTSVTVDRMLDNRLMQGYEDILREWPTCIGQYEPETRTVRWLFNPATDTENQEGTQPLLSYSLYHNSWYKYNMGTDSRVLDMAVIPYSANTETYNKFRYLIGRDNEANVFLTGWGVEVAFGPEGTGEWIQNGVITGEKFADYRLPDGVDIFRDPVPAFMLTNHLLPGKGIQWSQILYIVTHNRNVTETWRKVDDYNVRASMEGGTLLSIRWDWMDQKPTGKWSYPQQTYKYRRSYISSGETEDNTLGEPVLVHKLKLRGRGREFRLYFESDGHKDSHIEGWAYKGYVLNEV